MECQSWLVIHLYKENLSLEKVFSHKFSCLDMYVKHVYGEIWAC